MLNKDGGQDYPVFHRQVTQFPRGNCVALDPLKTRRSFDVWPPSCSGTERCMPSVSSSGPEPGAAIAAHCDLPSFWDCASLAESGACWLDLKAQWAKLVCAATKGIRYLGATLIEWRQLKSKTTKVPGPLISVSNHGPRYFGAIFAMKKLSLSDNV